MKVLVTGAAGFIGSHLSERLLSMGHEVVGIDSFTDYYPRVLKDLNAKSIRVAGAKLFEMDLVGTDLSEAVDGVNYIYHLAAQPGISSKVPFENFVRNNVYATQNILEAALTSNTLNCFVNIGTSSIYGAHATDTEDAAPKPTSYYGVTKLASEQLVLAYNRDKGLPACSFRPFSVYGERERPEKLYPKLIKSILEGTDFTLFEGSEKHVRSYTYVGDIIDGLVSVIDNIDVCNGQIFNLGTDKTITTGDGISIIEKALGMKAKIVVVPKRPGDQLETSANILKARKLLNYNPQTLVQDGLTREANWYKQEIFGKIIL